MSDQTLGLGLAGGHAWVRAELDYVRHLIRTLFAEEARLSPIAAPALTSMSLDGGKQLRPLLVILGARLAGGADADYAGLPEPPRCFDEGVLLRLTGDFTQRLRSHGIDGRANPAIDAWKRAPAFAGGFQNRIYLLAAAIEILHLATLIHDDVIDDSPLRRGRPSARALMGGRHAVLLGDLLLTLCFALVHEAASPQTGQLLAAMVRLMVRAEFMQAQTRADLSAALDAPSRRSYERIISGKTGLLFTLALSAGAAELKAPAASLDRLRRAGYCIGLAFQLDDDRLDYQADRALLGKPHGQDLRDGQINMPLIAALRNAAGREAERAELKRLALAFHAGDEGCFERLAELVESLGGFEASRAMSRAYLERARRELAALRHDGEVPELFTQLFAFLGGRGY